MTANERRWACIHDRKPAVAGAPEACGKVAFYSRVPIVPGMLVRSADFVMPGGEPITPESAVVCGGCGAYLDMRFVGSTLTVLEEQ